MVLVCWRLLLGPWNFRSIINDRVIRIYDNSAACYGI